MQLDTCLVTHSVFDDAHETFVSTLPDNNCFANQLVATKSSRWRHSAASTVCACVQGRIEATEIGSLSLSATALCRHGDDIRTSNDEYTRTLHELAISDEKDTSVDIKDFSLSAFTAKLFDIIVVPDFGPISISCDSSVVPANNLRYLRV